MYISPLDHSEMSFVSTRKAYDVNVHFIYILSNCLNKISTYTHNCAHTSILLPRTHVRVYPQAIASSTYDQHVINSSYRSELCISSYVCLIFYTTNLDAIRYVTYRYICICNYINIYQCRHFGTNLT